MPKIELKNVTKRWGGFYAVEDLNLSIDDAASNCPVKDGICSETSPFFESSPISPI